MKKFKKFFLPLMLIMSFSLCMSLNSYAEETPGFRDSREDPDIEATPTPIPDFTVTPIPTPTSVPEITDRPNPEMPSPTPTPYPHHPNHNDDPNGDGPSNNGGEVETDSNLAPQTGEDGFYPAAGSVSFVCILIALIAGRKVIAK